MSEPTVARGERQYEIRIGDDVAGVAQYLDHGNQRIFFHTEVDPQFQGRGLSSKLIRGALDDTRAAGLRIVPVCPAVGRFVAKHDSYGDISDPVTRDVTDWLDNALR